MAVIFEILQVAVVVFVAEYFSQAIAFHTRIIPAIRTLEQDHRRADVSQSLCQLHEFESLVLG